MAPLKYLQTKHSALNSKFYYFFNISELAFNVENLIFLIARLQNIFALSQKGGVGAGLTGDDQY